jgi:hypothetical protein
MTERTAERAARIAITSQFLALVRTLGEVYRLRHARGAAFALADAMPYVTGGVMAACFCWLAVTLYFFGRRRMVIAAAACIVAAMLAYKAWAIGV